MYQLDLGDPRLVLPAPIYERIAGSAQTLGPAAAGRIVFMATDRPREGLVAVRRGGQSGTLVVGTAGDVAFYALPAEIEKPPPTSVALYEWRDQAAARHYAVEGAKVPAGYTRAERPLCRVWRYPIAADIGWK
jgi:hypothetical protein